MTSPPPPGPPETGPTRPFEVPGRDAAVGWAAVGAGLAVGAVLFVQRVGVIGLGGQGLGIEGFALVIGVVAVVAMAAVAGRAIDAPVVGVAVGALVVLVGSGAGRWGDEETYVGQGGGDVLRTAERSVGLMAVGVVVVVGASIVAAVRRRRAVPPRRVVAALVGLTLQAAGFVMIGLLVRDVVVGQWIEGRPRRRRGRLVPTPVMRAGPVGELWAQAAREEAAAVGAFGDLAARLEAVGAPADLVARSRAAAADEVRHARRCTALAIRCGAVATVPEPRPVTPSPAAPRSVELVRLAVESYVDGVVGEGMAAGRLERGATTAPHLAPTLTAIAGDERAHAALGADIVRWCASAAPRTVPLAVRAAARRVPVATMRPPGQAAHPDAALRAVGLVDGPGSQAVWEAERATAAATLHDVLA